MTAPSNPAMPDHVRAAFDQFPQRVRARLERIRTLIFEAARETRGVGPIDETLKWGEPAYLTAASGSGSTVRLGWPKAHPDCAAVYFNCRTNLVSTFRDIYPEAFGYSGDRALLLNLDKPIDEASLRVCIAMAQTYRRTKGRRATD